MKGPRRIKYIVFGEGVRASFGLRYTPNRKELWVAGPLSARPFMLTALESFGVNPLEYEHEGFWRMIGGKLKGEFTVEEAAWSAGLDSLEGKGLRILRVSNFRRLTR